MFKANVLEHTPNIYAHDPLLLYHSHEHIPASGIPAPGSEDPPKCAAASPQPRLKLANVTPVQIYFFSCPGVTAVRLAYASAMRWICPSRGFRCISDAYTSLLCGDFSYMRQAKAEAWSAAGFHHCARRVATAPSVQNPTPSHTRSSPQGSIRSQRAIFQVDLGLCFKTLA